MSNPYLQHRERIDKPKYSDDHFDKSLIHSKRSRFKLKMNEPGKYIKKAKKEQLQVKIEEKRSILEKRAKEKEEYIRKHWSRVEIPQVEWWDSALIHPHTSYDDIDTSSLFDSPVPQLATEEEPNGSIPITHLILHPLLPSKDGKPLKLPTYLTKIEFKKMRRLKRLDTQREKQEMILLGELVEEPKLKLNNYGKVLPAEVLQDPTRAEQMVLDQVAARQQKHIEHNLESKLTKEQRKTKIIKKWETDRKKGLYRLVYKLDTMNFQIKNKIDLNAVDMHMTGVLIWLKEQNKCMLIVEGGRVACNRMNNLLSRRIKWDGVTQDTNDMDMDIDDMDIDTHKSVHYSMLWKGSVKQSLFKDKIGEFRVKLCNEDSLKDYIEYLGSDMRSYWNLIQ